MDQIPVLALLYYKDGLSQQEICSCLQRDKASVNRTVSFLSKRDMAKVVQDVTDKRKTRVELTAAGKELAIQVDAVVKKVDTILTSALTEKEVEQFYTLTNKLIETSFT
ncbi:MAG TPA: MarR family transcriptional regulator [Puia sp.]|nr:MarR family transcriptional regulator [Puia sp.]